MHIKRIHEMIKKLTECAMSEMNSGMANVDTEEMALCVDMIKDLCCAEKDALITKAMQEAEEEEKLIEKLGISEDDMRYYGGSNGSRRYYDNYRYANGRFAPKGRGTRRGYDEPVYYHMTPSEYREHLGDMDYWRDMDRQSLGRMYYSSGQGGNSSTGGASSGSMGYSENSRGYSNNTRNYGGNSRGYESRSERARRGYEETREMHKGNSAEDKQNKMQSLEEYMKELSSDLTDLVKEMTPEERSMMKSKLTTLANKV